MQHILKKLKQILNQINGSVQNIKKKNFKILETKKNETLAFLCTDNDHDTNKQAKTEKQFQLL